MSRSYGDHGARTVFLPWRPKVMAKEKSLPFYSCFCHWFCRQMANLPLSNKNLVSRPRCFCFLASQEEPVLDWLIATLCLNGLSPRSYSYNPHNFFDRRRQPHALTTSLQWRPSHHPISPLLYNLVLKWIQQKRKLPLVRGSMDLIPKWVVVTCCERRSVTRGGWQW